jgi:hypothetical protein
MAGIKIEGGSSTAGSPNVDSTYNLNVNLPVVTTQAGFASIQSRMDSGAITGTPLVRTPHVGEDSRLSVGIDTMLSLYNFTTTAQNTGDWKYAAATMTSSQSAGFLNINPALSTVSGNYTYMQTWKHHTLQGDGSLNIEFTGLISAAPPANQLLEAGLFLGTAGVAPTDGCFWRLSSAGLAGIMTYNGVETSTGVLIASLTVGSVASFQIIISQRRVEYWVDGTLYGYMAVPSGNAVPYLSMNLPVCLMMRNSGTVTGGFTTKIGTLHVTMTDLAATKDWSIQKAMQGDAYQGQDGDTQGSLAMYSNAAVAAAAALTNTTAAAGNIGLGGVVLVLPTLTSGTDGILLSYQNPVGSVTQPPKTLVVQGIRIFASVQTALTGGPLTLVMGAAFGHTALSLATVETGSFVTATTKAPRRVPLGNFDFVVTAAAGIGVPSIWMQFLSPLVVNPGEYFAITCRNLGTVTTLGALAITVSVDHFFE